MLALSSAPEIVASPSESVQTCNAWQGIYGGKISGNYLPDGNDADVSVIVNKKGMDFNEGQFNAVSLNIKCDRNVLTGTANFGPGGMEYISMKLKKEPDGKFHIRLYDYRENGGPNFTVLLPPNNYNIFLRKSD